MKKKYNKTKLKEIILVVNEIHHDYVDNYNLNNKIMHERERKNWHKILKKFNFDNKIILEIGTGTGFLPETFLKNNVEVSQYVCTDISKKILNKAKKNIKKISSGKINFKFIKLDSQKLPFPDKSFDMVILNSVLHHLPDIRLFYNEANRILKKEGFLIIGHEPNFFFFNNKFLFNIYKILSFLISSIGKVIRLRYNNNVPMWVNKINITLKNKQLISKSLTHSEINKLIDYHTKKGINPLKINKSLFSVKYIKTYNYLSTLNFAYDNKLYLYLTRLYDLIMSKIFNEMGSNYFVVYKKN